MSQTVTPEGVPMKCYRCMREWLYMGKNPYFANCSFCHSSLSLNKHRTDGKGQKDARRHNVLNLKEPLFKDRKLLKK